MYELPVCCFGHHQEQPAAWGHIVRVACCLLRLRHQLGHTLLLLYTPAAEGAARVKGNSSTRAAGMRCMHGVAGEKQTEACSW